MHTYLLTCYKTCTHPVLGGYLDIWLVGKMLVKRVPIWCRIKFHCFYNFADETTVNQVFPLHLIRMKDIMEEEIQKRVITIAKQNQDRWRKRVEFNLLLQKKI